MGLVEFKAQLKTDLTANITANLSKTPTDIVNNTAKGWNYDVANDGVKADFVVDKWSDILIGKYRKGSGKTKREAADLIPEEMN